jgi:Uma2 family endonuclease
MGALKYEEHYTYEDYVLWEGEWEIIEGFPYAMSPKPMIKHQRVSGKIFSQLDKNSCKKCLVAIEIDYKIAEDTVVSPDVLLACGDDLGDKYLKKAPKVVFEILSPSTQKKDKTVKYNLYQKEGIKYYVIVDSVTKTAEIYLLQDFKYKLDKKITDEKYGFDIDGCIVDFEFKNIWA